MYSFAMLMFDLVTRTPPFEGYSAMVVGMRVARDNLRPQIPDYVPVHLKKLIELCWSEQVSRRPAFADIGRVLTKVIDLQG